MILQGVNILRISDLRRFFDLADFWSQKEAFVSQIGDIGTSIFFDTELEKGLYLLLKNWLVSDLGVALIYKDDGLIVVNMYGQDITFSLGRITPEYEKYKGKVRNKDLNGLTLLYLLLGANVNSNIELQYDIFAALKTGNYVGEFIPCYGNMSAKSVSFPEYPLSRHIIANMSSIATIEVSAGTKVLKLTPGDCVIGIFDSNNLCYKLFSNMIEDTGYGISLRLRINFNTKKPFLKIDSKYSGTKNIEEVCSFALDKGGLPVYLTMDGEMHYDKACFSLHSKYETYKQHNPDVKLLAFDVDSSNNYSFFTSNKKLY